MASSPDPLFRNGLEHYRRPAPASVWDRIESGLDRKRRKSMWLKVAAGLFLLIASSVSLLLREKLDPIIETVSTTTTAPALKPVEPITGSHQLSAISYQSSAISYQPSAISYQSSTSNNLKPHQVNPIVERTSAERSRSSRNNHTDVVHGNLPVVERSRNEPRRGSQQSSVGSQKTISSLGEEQSITLVEPEEINTEPTPLNLIEGSVNNDVIVEQKGTSITYTSDEVNEKFLKKDLPTQATPVKKNASGLQKVIDKAVELTNEGTVYGELREKKNEWLSFNMLSNKTEANK